MNKSTISLLSPLYKQEAQQRVSILVRGLDLYSFESLAHLRATLHKWLFSLGLSDFYINIAFFNSTVSILVSSSLNKDIRFYSEIPRSRFKFQAPLATILDIIPERRSFIPLGDTPEIPSS